MINVNNDFNNWKQRDARFGEFLKLRREQLGLSVQKLESLLSRKKCNGFDRIESGQKKLDSREYFHVEQALQLPEGFLAHLAVEKSPLGGKSASEILDALQIKQALEIEDLSLPAINTCSVCGQPTRWILKRYSLPFRQRAIKTKSCLCEGKRHSESDILLRLALAISGVRSILILGGSPDIDKSFDDISNVKIFIVRQTQQAGLSPQRISEVDVIIVARGQVGHSVTAPYLNVLKSLPKERRPIVLKPRSSSVTAIADELIWSREEIHEHINLLINRSAHGMPNDK